MRSKKNKIISFILTMVMIISLIPVITISVSAALPDDKLILKYSMDEMVNGYFLDALGKGNNALGRNMEVKNDPTRGNVASFNGVNGFIQLPEGFMENLNEISISVWYYYADPDLRVWSRIYDFGNTHQEYFMCSPNSGNSVVELGNNSTFGQWAGDPRADGSNNLSTVVIGSDIYSDKWTHLVVTVNSTDTKIYINGKLDTSGETKTLPKDIGYTVQNYLGRSMYPDPYFMGMMDDLAIYSVALTDAQVTELYNAPKFTTPDAAKTNVPAAVKTVATHDNTTDNIVAFYPLNSIENGLLIDDLNKNDGLVFGNNKGAEIVKDPTRGNVLKLDGRHGFAQLPNGMFNNLDEMTICAWYYFDTKDDTLFPDGRNWSRVFDMGTGNTTFVYISPQCGDTICAGGEVKLNDDSHRTAAGDVYADKWVFAALTLGKGESKLYIDGKLQDTMEAPFNPKDLGDTFQNNIGKSMYPDPLFRGMISNLVIYNKVLSDAEVAAAMTKDYTYLAANVTPAADTAAPAVADTTAAPAADTTAAAVDTTVAVVPVTATTTAPTTGDNTLAIMAVMVLAAAGVVIFRRKISVK